MTQWIHHILFEPLSAWEQLKLEALLAPPILMAFLIWALYATRRKK